MKKEQILGFDICTYNQEELLDNIFNDYANNEQLFIVNISNSRWNRNCLGI